MSSPSRTRDPRPEPEKELVGACPHGRKIFLVDGTHVRDRHDSDFCQGGNGYRYLFIPRGELWVDACIPAEEWELVAAHECEEAELMMRGMPYDQAHARAKRLEDAARAARRSA